MNRYLMVLSWAINVGTAGYIFMFIILLLLFGVSDLFFPGFFRLDLIGLFSLIGAFSALVGDSYRVYTKFKELK